MVQSAVLTRRLMGALPDEVSGVRRHRKVSHVPRRNRAAERSTHRKGTERHVAVARERGRLLNGHCAAESGEPRGPDGIVGRAEGNGPWREVSCVTEERSDVVPRLGQRTVAGAPNGWRDRCRETRRGRRMRRQGNTRQRARLPQHVAESERPAMAGNGLPITT